MDGAGPPPLFSTCPKCGHRRQPSEQSLDPGQCPACGLVFAKWMRRGSFVPSSLKNTPDHAEDTPSAGLLARLTEAPGDFSLPAWWGRLALGALLGGWSWRLAGYDYRTGEMGGSFMHAILLPIHEAGHILFIPLGEFMSIAGGSLFQWLLPLICAATLLLKNRDPFGAAIGLWWSGTSLTDLAPYIYDAKNPKLILLGGHTGDDGPHDWIYLLDQFGHIDRAPAYGGGVHFVGVTFMVIGLGWAAMVLLRQQRRGAVKTTIK